MGKYTFLPLRISGRFLNISVRKIIDQNAFSFPLWGNILQTTANEDGF